MHRKEMKPADRKVYGKLVRLKMARNYQRSSCFAKGYFRRSGWPPPRQWTMGVMQNIQSIHLTSQRYYTRQSTMETKPWSAGWWRIIRKILTRRLSMEGQC